MRRQFGIRWMARLLLVCMLVGVIPTGVFAIEGDSSSLAEDAPEYRRADTATEQALKSEINSLAAPVYTHNEKVDFYGTSQATFRNEADGSSYFFVNPHGGDRGLARSAGKRRKRKGSEDRCRLLLREYGQDPFGSHTGSGVDI